MSLRDRVAMLERQHGPSAPELVIITGGLESNDPTFALVGASTLARAPDEPFGEFKARALAAATAAHEPFAIIGGLPDG